MRILLTTTSFQDTPGRHHDLLKNSGFEVVTARGPLHETQMLELIRKDGDAGGFDGLLNGDDAITAKVIDVALPRLKVIAKYGIGLDSIDVKYATSRKLPVLFTPGVNHTTVAEHTFGLMIAAAKHFWPHLRSVKGGGWKRITGSELAGKTIAVLGVGRIGKEVVKRAIAFDMTPIGYDCHWDAAFAAQQHGLKHAATIDDAIENADFVSLHMSLADDDRGMVNKAFIDKLKKGAVIINTARGGLVNEADVAEACRSGRLGGYAADVLDVEPQKVPHVFQDIDNIIVTPHVGSRTFESVERQALRAVTNIVEFLKGGKDFIQANPF
ncbi:MAG: phosphoglycerate dehydrogenase [Phycisphaerales bacterium]|nr:phosphoglycerate dehydrogenase [Phycisphaerales bacterium]